ncbi:MAG: hypothetical protein QG650_502 [Patescibacteria group bacterium]|nr:hypothetical protein [Patescibacteria group bacterium]
MISRILWSFVLITTLYVVSVFLLPEKADEIGDVLRIKTFNEVLRETKNGSSEDIVVPGLKELNEGSGALQNARRTVADVKNQVEQTRNVVETKVEQTKKVVNSVQKTAGAIEELKNNVSELTTLTGASATGSTSTGSSASGAKR